MSYLKVNSALDYRPAGVTFRIEIDLTEVSQAGASLKITPINSHNGANIPITDEASVVLADFAQAFARWMRTRRVTASVEGDHIAGTFHQELTIKELLQYASDICEMINQRFSLYQESVIG